MNEHKEVVETFTVSYNNTQYMRDRWDKLFNSVEPKLLNPITGELTSIEDITVELIETK